MHEMGDDILDSTVINFCIFKYYCLIYLNFVREKRECDQIQIIA